MTASPTSTQQQRDVGFDSSCSLRTNWTRLLKQSKDVASQSSQSVFESLVADWAKLQQAIDSANLYSTENETVAEIATDVLPYLTAQFHAADLQFNQRNIDQRLDSILSAILQLQKFMRLMSQFELLDKQDEQQWNQLQHQFSDRLNQLQLSTPQARLVQQAIAQSLQAVRSANDDEFNAATVALPPSPTSRRASKIARYKRDKELSTRIEQIQSQIDKQQKQQNNQSRINASNNNNNQQQQERNQESDQIDSTVDDELHRELSMLQMQQSISASINHIANAMQEIEFLQHRATQQQQHRSQPSHQAAIQHSRQQGVQFSSSNQPPHKPSVFKLTPDTVKQPIPQHMSQYLQRLPQSAANDNASAAAASRLRSGEPRTSVSSQRLIASVPQSSGPSTADSQLAQQLFDQSLLRSSGPGARAQYPNSIDALTVNLQHQLSTSSRLREKVFRTPNPATMTVDEWAVNEQAEGRLPTPEIQSTAQLLYDQRRATHVQSTIQRSYGDEQQALSEDEADHRLNEDDSRKGETQRDAKTLEEREWDNWKDEHEKGIGNRMK